MAADGTGVRTWFLIGAAVVALTAGACGADGEQAAAKRRYCSLAEELSRKAEGAFMDLAPDAPPDHVAQAYAAFLSMSASEIDEIERVAPDEIRAQVLAQISAQRQAASGDLQGLSAVRALGEEVREYEDTECRHRR